MLRKSRRTIINFRLDDPPQFPEFSWREKKIFLNLFSSKFMRTIIKPGNKVFGVWPRAKKRVLGVSKKKKKKNKKKPQRMKISFENRHSTKWMRCQRRKMSCKIVAWRQLVRAFFFYSVKRDFIRGGKRKKQIIHIQMVEFFGREIKKRNAIALRSLSLLSPPPRQKNPLKVILTCNITYSSDKLFLTKSSVMEASRRISEDRKLSFVLTTLGLTKYCWIPTT